MLGADESHALGVSADGSFVVGESDEQAFRWDPNGGMINLGSLPDPFEGSPFNGYIATSVSADGLSIVGYGHLWMGWEEGDLNQAFHWLPDRGMGSLADLPGQVVDQSHAYAIAADGSVAVGKCGPEACLWSKATGGEAEALFPRCPDGMHCEGEGYFSYAAKDVSANGTVVVGGHWHGNEGFYWENALRWTKQDGPIFLDPLHHGGPCGATAVSANGLVVVGWCGGEAFRWTENGGMAGLGILPGHLTSSASDVTADGKIIIGNSEYTDAFDDLHITPFIWDPVNGIRSMRDVFTQVYGLLLAGWTLNSANAISEDGKTIVGDGINPVGQLEAWIADLDTSVRTVQAILVLREKDGPKHLLDVLEVPQTSGDNASRILRDANIYTLVEDIGSGFLDDGPLSKVFILREMDSTVNKLYVHELPDGNPGDIGNPVVSDLAMGRRGQHIAVGDFDGDDADEIAIVARNKNYPEKYQLFLYELPDGVKGSTGPAYASDPTVGRRIRGTAAGDWDDDGTDELVILRGNSVQIYAVPTTIKGNIGTSLASDNSVGSNVIDRGIAAGNFDNDTDIEIALVRKKKLKDTFRLMIYDAPYTVGGDIGSPIASDNNIGTDVKAIAACSN